MRTAHLSGWLTISIVLTHYDIMLTHLWPHYDSFAYRLSYVSCGHLHSHDSYLVFKERVLYYLHHWIITRIWSNASRHCKFNYLLFLKLPWKLCYKHNLAQVIRTNRNKIIQSYSILEYLSTEPIKETNWIETTSRKDTTQPEEENLVIHHILAPQVDRDSKGDYNQNRASNNSKRV